jgi:hypothetical protein
MRGDQRFGSGENLAADVNERPVPLICGHASHYFWHSRGIERTFRRASSHRASHFDRQNR